MGAAQSVRSQSARRGTLPLIACGGHRLTLANQVGTAKDRWWAAWREWKRSHSLRERA